MTENRISSERLDSTTAQLSGGVRSVAIERTVSEMEGWRRKLETSGDPGIQPIAGNLAELEWLLTATSRTRSPPAGCLRSLEIAPRRG